MYMIKDEGISKRQKDAVDCSRYGYEAVCLCDNYHTGDGASSVKLKL